MTVTPKICEWLQGQTPLLTGGNGFLGLSMLYKLCQCGCPKIYLPIRPKYGLSPEERLEKIINGTAMRPIKDKDALRKKIVLVPVNTDVVGLDFSEEHRNLIKEEVTVIIHGAASIKFDDTLTKAVISNIRFTRDLLELSQEIKNLKAFTLVSTAYSNLEYMEKGVEERLYERKMDWKALLKAVETTPEEVMNGLEKKLLGVCPNTYIFTKHLSESVVADYSHLVPTLIIRPPIVVIPMDEPIPGWVHSLSSPMAIALASAKGVMRVYHGDGSALRAYYPVDMVTNGTIVATWHKAVGKSKENLPVYNTSYFLEHALGLMRLGDEALKIVPLKNILWHPILLYFPHRHTFLLMHLLLHFLPGLLLDGLLKLNGKKPRLTKLYRKMYISFVTLAPFLNIFEKDWFRSEKYERIMSEIPEEETDIFKYKTEWEKRGVELIANGIYQAREIFGEPMETSPNDFIHTKRMYYVHQATMMLLGSLALWHFPYSILFSIVNAIWSYFVSALDVNQPI